MAHAKTRTKNLPPLPVGIRMQNRQHRAMPVPDRQIGRGPAGPNQWGQTRLIWRLLD